MVKYLAEVSLYNIGGASVMASRTTLILYRGLIQEGGGLGVYSPPYEFEMSTKQL